MSIINFNNTTPAAPGGNTNITWQQSGDNVSGYVPSSGGGGGGAMVLLAEYTASSSASLAFTTRNAAGQSGAIFQSDYDTYVIEFVNVLPATSAVDIGMNFSTNGGSSYDTTSSYSWASYNFIAVGSSLHGSTNDTKYTMTGGGGEVSNSTTFCGVCGSWKLYGPANAATIIQGDGVYYDTTGYALRFPNGGFYYGASGVNAFEILASSGNLASGTVRVYGLSK